MKKISFVLLLFAFQLFSCEEPLFGPKLPKATMTGENTFGCKINGELFLPDADNFITLELYAAWSKGGFLLQAVNRNMGRFGIRYKKDFYSIGTYPVKWDRSDEIFVYYNTLPSPATYYYADSTTGNLTITKLDTINRIASGTFSFDAVSDSGEVIKVTDGRFDVFIGD